MPEKYAPLEDHLQNLPHEQTEVTLSFEEIEAIIRSRLPSSAYEYRQWWEHEKEGNHINARAWANAGWKIETLNLAEKWVRLVRIR